MAHRAASRVLFPSRVGAPDTEESDSTYSAQSISSNSTFSFDPTLPTVATTNTKPSLPSSHLGSSQPSFDSDAEDYCSVLTADSPAESLCSDDSNGSGDVEYISVASSTSASVARMEANFARSTSVLSIHSYSDATRTNHSLQSSNFCPNT
jgi:hypothetical protein